MVMLWGTEALPLAVTALIGPVLAILMQTLAARLVGLTTEEMLVPLSPGLCAAALTASVVGLTAAGLRQWAPVAPEWIRLVSETAAGGVAWLAFVLFVRFPGLQIVVDEVLDDL